MNLVFCLPLYTLYISLSDVQKIVVSVIGGILGTSIMCNFPCFFVMYTSVLHFSFSVLQLFFVTWIRFVSEVSN